jgi:hypothetical protein
MSYLACSFFAHGLYAEAFIYKCFVQNISVVAV